MEVTFEQLREKEIISITTGKKLGRIVDLVFELSNGSIKGIMVPGDKKLFKKTEDIFIPIRQIYRIGDDVILVKLNSSEIYQTGEFSQNSRQSSGYISKNTELREQFKLKKANSFIRYRRINKTKYK